MRLPQHRPAGTRQRGAVLMLMVVIMVIGISAVLISSLSAARLKNARQESTADALARAKEALIGYAIIYGDTHPGNVHGYLPCPDNDGINPEGSAEPSCGSKNISVLGRLPWKTLGLPILRDGDGECLWYAVSGTYKNNPKTDMMNWDTNGLFGILDANGATVAQNVVAVVFAPGATLGSQNRAPDGTAPLCGGNYTASNYLDNDGTHNNSTVSAIANAVSSFFSGPSPQVNDRMVYITRDDIFNALMRRSDFMSTLTLMTQRVAECIAYYGRNNANHDNNSLPWPASLSLSDYTDKTKYNDISGLYAGRIPYYVNTSRPVTYNQIVSSIDNYLLKTSVCPAGWSAVDPWWNNWKDHLFYAIGQEFAPLPYWWWDTQSCGTCLHVNGHGQYAAVVMFAGRKLSAQDRTDKSVLGAYLEGRNLSTYPNTWGNSNCQVSATSDTFNDVLYCIDQNLNVMSCPP